MLSRKNPALFESLKILAIYAILLRPLLIACKSFMEALLSVFQRFVCRLALPSNRWLKRPAPIRTGLGRVDITTQSRFTRAAEQG